MKILFLAASLALSSIASSAPLTTASNVESPVIAATDAALKTDALDPSMAHSWLDAPMSAIGDGYFLSSHSVDPAYSPEPESLHHVMTHGSYGAPYANEQWIKRTCQRVGHFCTNQTSGAFAFTGMAAGLTDVVNLWFLSVYNPGGAERLAFVHEENAGWTGFANGNWEGKTRIGLAYSADSGNTWKYLGRIASPYQEKQPWNIQGAPYMVVNGTFYVWYMDYDGTGGGYAVSKANVASVLAAARTGTLGSGLWSKKTATGWSTSIAAKPAFPAGSQAQGIVHSQAAHAADGNYYLVTTSQTGGGWGTPSSYVKLFIVDPVTLAWTFVANIADEPTATVTNGTVASGYQYASIVDGTGRADGNVGAAFYVYSAKFAPTFPTQALYQWRIDTVAPSHFSKESKDFSSTQGGGGWNYAAVLSGAWMSWNSGYWWQQADPFNRIYNGSMSTGNNDGFLLIWTAPQTGTVRVRQTVRTSQPTLGCGSDGVDVAFQQEQAVLFSGHVGWNDTLGLSYNKDIPVTAGQHFYFYGTKGGNNYCDGVYWDPSIVYD